MQSGIQLAFLLQKSELVIVEAPPFFLVSCPKLGPIFSGEFVKAAKLELNFVKDGFDAC